jgi:hypothetical protein
MFWLSLLLLAAVVVTVLQIRRVLRRSASHATEPDEAPRRYSSSTFRERTVREKLESHGWL